MIFLQTIVETKSEREARGHPVGRDVPYAAMGGLTGFSSLAEGYMRLDDSGIGAPSREILENPIGLSLVLIETKLNIINFTATLFHTQGGFLKVFTTD